MRLPSSVLAVQTQLFSIGDKEVTMSETDEKLIVKLGRRMSEQNEILRMIAASLQGVESHLRQMAVSSNTAPNYQRPLSEYPTFDWSSINATVLNWDDDGATSVEWNGQVFTRRSPSNKFDAAVWFSRHLGQDSDGNKRYARLISFRALNDAEPIAAKAKKAIRA
jgi:DdrB-like protein